MASEQATPGGLRQAIDQALGALDARELQLFTLAVLHGMPVRQLPELPGRSADDHQDALIATLKKIRSKLAQAGYDGERTLTLFQARAR